MQQHSKHQSKNDYRSPRYCPHTQKKKQQNSYVHSIHTAPAAKQLFHFKLLSD